MKLSNIKTVLGLSVGSAAVMMMAACSGSVASVGTEAGTSPVTVTAGPLEAKEVMFTMDVAAQKTAPVEAGMLVKGSSTLVYYVTDDGTLRPVPDHDTFAAFGFSPQEVIVVDDDILSVMPKGDVLTRLLFDSKDYLYWVAKGQRWQAHAWKSIVREFPQHELAVSHLDGSLQDRLPVHSLNGQLLRGQGGLVYYHANRFITPLPSNISYDEMGIIDVPESALAAYTLHTQLKEAWTILNDSTQAANVRKGPSLNSEVIGTIDKTDRILIRGRAEDSNWLLIDYQGQDAWLAGDLVEDQYLVSLLPIVTFQPSIPKASEPQQIQVSSTPTTQPVTAIPNCHAQPIRGFGTVWQNHPEVRQLLGCPFTNFRRNEHATKAAVQTFQHGWMLWLETDTVANVDPIYVFFDDNDSYVRYGDRALVDAHSFAPTPPGFYKVGDRFAKVYWEELGTSGRQRLGFATNEARDSNGAFQEFQTGRMFWAGEADTIYIIYQGNFDFDGDGTFTWTQGWTSYEDTFEDPLED